MCPFYFPILVKEGRSELQQFLAKNDIYATIIWKCPQIYEGKIDVSAQYIYDHILCLHVDQRYNLDDMNLIMMTLVDFYHTGWK